MHLIRKFDMQLFETRLVFLRRSFMCATALMFDSLEDMVFRDHMVPVWTTKPLQAIVTEQVE